MQHLFLFSVNQDAKQTDQVNNRIILLITEALK